MVQKDYMMRYPLLMPNNIFNSSDILHAVLQQQQQWLNLETWGHIFTAHDPPMQKLFEQKRCQWRTQHLEVEG